MVSQAAGRVPVYCGIGAIRTQKCVRIAKMAREVGARGISVLQPMFLKPTEEELFRHFRTIADAVSVPVIASGGAGKLEHLYDVFTDGHAHAVLAASIFHFGTFTVPEAKQYLASRGIPVRITE